MFGGAEKKAQVQTLLSSRLPICPICGSKKGYEIHVGLKDRYFVCLVCRTAFGSKDLPSELKNIRIDKLGENIAAGRHSGREILGQDMPLHFWQDFQKAYPAALEQRRAEIEKNLSGHIILQENEKLLNFFMGTRSLLNKDAQGNVSRYFRTREGVIYLTTHRLVWIEDGIFSFDVPLENVDSIAGVKWSTSGGEVFASGINIISKSKNIDELFNFTYPPANKVDVTAEDLWNLVKSTALERTKVLKAQKRMERVQVVLDFTSLKEVLSKGGVVMSTFKCPNCGATVNIPDSGKVVACKHCGAPVKAIDIFEKIKSLLT